MRGLTLKLTVTGTVAAAKKGLPAKGLILFQQYQQQQSRGEVETESDDDDEDYVTGSSDVESSIDEKWECDDIANESCEEPEMVFSTDDNSVNADQRGWFPPVGRY